MNAIIHFGQNQKPKQTCAELLLAMVGAWVQTPMKFMNSKDATAGKAPKVWLLPMVVRAFIQKHSYTCMSVSV